MQKIKTQLIDLFDRLERISDTFGSNTVALLSVSLILAAGMLVVNDRLIIHAKEKADDLTTLDHLLIETWQTRARLAVAESSQRGYLLTRSESYFQPYDDATEQIGRHLQTIDQLLIQANLASHPDLQRNMNDLVSSISKKSAEMSVTVDLAKKHQFDKALAVIRLESGVKESRNIDMLSRKFEDQLLSYRNVVVESRDHARRMARLFVMACPLIFVSLVVLVIRRLLKELAEKAKLHERLTVENTEYESNIESLKTRLQGQALQAQTNIERERYKLSRELHDELGSLLTAIKMDISWAIKHLQEQAPQVTEKLKKTNQYVDRSINFKREIVQSLHPAMIKSFGLIASLQNLIDEAQTRNQWQMDIIMPEQEMWINETVSLIIYRIVQESLNNCSKYAKATRVSVHLMRDDHHIKLEVVDNGVGFDPLSLSNKTNGISGMRNRVESIGGYYEISSSLQKGASTRVILPYLKEDAV